MPTRKFVNPVTEYWNEEVLVEVGAPRKPTPLEQFFAERAEFAKKLEDDLRQKGYLFDIVSG